MMQKTQRTGKVGSRAVVGVDGSPASLESLTWAIEAARSIGGSVHVVTAWPDPEDVFVHDVPGHFCEPRARAVLAQQRALSSALEGREVSTTVITLEVANARPVDALRSVATEGDLIVVGASRPGRPQRRHPAIGEAVSLVAPCPVVIIDRPPVEPDRVRAGRLRQPMPIR